MFTNWNRKAKEETRLNPLSIDEIDALTISTLRGMGTTPEKFREQVRQDMPEDAMEQGDAIMRRNPKMQMPDSHFKLQGAQEQQMMDDIELEVPEFYFDEGAENARLGVQQLARDESTQRALNAYKDTYKDHVMQAFDKHKAFMQSLGNQPMTVQEFMQHPKVPSFADYYKHKNAQYPYDTSEDHPFALTHPDDFAQHQQEMLEQYEIQGYPVNEPFIPVITGEPMDLALDVLLKQLELTPPMTQGVEEQIPMQEDIPTVNVTQDYETDCECADRIRNDFIQKIIDSGDLEAINGPYGIEWLKSLSCEEIKVELSPRYNAICSNKGGFSEADQMKYAGKPMDLAMDTLLKFQSAAQRRIYSEIPTPQDYGLEIKDVPFIRNIGVHRIESAGMPAYNIPVPLRGNRPGDPLEFERQIAREGGATIPGFTLDYEIPDDPRKEIQGHFGYPNDLQSITPELRMGYPDFNWGIGDTVTLGILDKPEWMAGMAQGRTQPEGYQPFGFDKDAFVRLDGGLGTAAIAPRRELVSSARRLLTGNPLTGDEYKYYDYKPVYDMLSQLPATTIESQRDPVTGYLPKTSDFLLDRMGGARIVASEPMDLAIDALLKNDSEQEEETDVHPGDKTIEMTRNGRRYFPTTLVHDDATEGIQRRVNPFDEEEGTFEGLPFKDDFKRSKPMDLAMDALLKNQPYHEMSKDQLDEILYGLGGYDAGTREYSRDETSSTQEEKDAAYRELLARQREADANPVNVFGLDQEDKSRLVDFYEPQFTGQNISPDIFIPQTEEEGQMAFDEGDMEHDIDERLLDIDEFMPGKSFLTEEDPAAKYHHLKATAGDDVAQNYLNRYRDFAMRNSENPEYVHQRLMQMFDENQEVTAPQYTQEFPTDESIFNVKPPHVMMNEPDATGFAHNWQAKNASEPMDLAIDTLLKDLSPEAKRHKLEYDKKYESSPERVKYREELNRERRRRGIYGSGDHMDVSHTEGGKLTLESEHDNRARHFKEKGTLRPSE